MYLIDRPGDGTARGMARKFTDLRLQGTDLAVFALRKQTPARPRFANRRNFRDRKFLSDP